MVIPDGEQHAKATGGILTNLRTLLRFLLPFSALPKTHWTIKGGEERGGVHRQGEKQDTWMVSLGNGPSPKALAPTCSVL